MQGIQKDIDIPVERPTLSTQLSAITHVAKLHMATDNLEYRLVEALEIVSREIGVDKLALFEVSNGSRAPKVILRSEWVAPNITHFGSDQNMLTPLSDLGIERWKIVLSSGVILSGERASFPKAEQIFFEARQSLSSAIIPIFIEDMWWGFLEADDCTLSREWDANSLFFLESIATIFGSAMHKEKVNATIERFNQELYELRLLRDTMAQELDDINNWKSHIFSSFSHEFQTPLYTLLGFSATLLENEELDEDSDIRKTCLQHIYEQSKRLEKLVSEMMYASKLQTQSFQTEMHDIQLEEILSEIETIFRVRSAKASVDFYYEVPQNDLILKGDTPQIRQLVYNLLDFALKATPPNGWISLNVSSDSTHIILRIADSGVGISKQQIDRIFEPFYANADPSNSASGGGLGLSIAKDIVDLHGGFITVDSKENEGAVFTVVLPRSQTKP